MADDPKPRVPESGWPVILMGVILSGLGATVIAADGDAAFLGWALLAVGAAVAQIGIVAVGVTMGLRRADYLRNL
ncbi:MAG: hypothetical protein ACPF9W_00560 [Nocardioides sp.]